MSDFDVFPLFPNETYYNNMYLSEFDVNKQNNSVNKTQDIISLNDTPRYDIPVSATNVATELSRQIEPTNLGYPIINSQPNFKLSIPNTASGFHGGNENIVIQPIVLYFILFIIVIFAILQYKAMKTIKKLTKQITSLA